MNHLVETEIAAFGGVVRPRALRLAVAVAFGVLDADIEGRSRKPAKARARFAFAHLARVRLGLSYPAIGAACGGRDHTTAQHARRRGEEMMRADPDFAARCALVEARLWPADPSAATPS